MNTLSQTAAVAQLPNIITHNYDPSGTFLQNLCDLPEIQAERILDRLRAAGTRNLKADYLQRRLVTEDWLIRERRKKLGPTRLERPIYFLLGDFADGRDLSRPCSLVMPLSAFPPTVLTFTYPDSMASLPIATRPSISRTGGTTTGTCSRCAKSRRSSPRSGCLTDARRAPNRLGDTVGLSRFRSGTRGQSKTS